MNDVKYPELRAALIEAQRAINSMKVEAETAAQLDEQAMLEAMETISNQGLAADTAIRRVLADATCALRGAQKEGGWIDLTDEDRERAFRSMPDMLEGFMKTWGWLHFAKAIEAACREKNQQGEAK